MRRGKKSLALRLMYDALDIVKEKTGKEPMEILDTALKNVGPSMEVKPRRVGGATYQVPMEVPTSRRTPWPCAGSLTLPEPVLEIPMLKNWQPN